MNTFIESEQSRFNYSRDRWERRGRIPGARSIDLLGRRTFVFSFECRVASRRFSSVESRMLDWRLSDWRRGIMLGDRRYLEGKMVITGHFLSASAISVTRIFCFFFFFSLYRDDLSGMYYAKKSAVNAICVSCDTSFTIERCFCCKWIVWQINPRKSVERIERTLEFRLAKVHARPFRIIERRGFQKRALKLRREKLRGEREREKLRPIEDGERGMQSITSRNALVRSGYHGRRYERIY